MQTAIRPEQLKLSLSYRKQNALATTGPLKKVEKKKIPWKKGTTDRVLLHHFNWIQLHELHNVYQKPRHLTTSTKSSKHEPRMIQTDGDMMTNV